MIKKLITTLEQHIVNKLGKIFASVLQRYPMLAAAYEVAANEGRSPAHISRTRRNAVATQLAQNDLLRCTKTLLNYKGEICFLENEIYEIQRVYFKGESIDLIDERGYQHTVNAGAWLDNFVLANAS